MRQFLDQKEVNLKLANLIIFYYGDTQKLKPNGILQKYSQINFYQIYNFENLQKQP